MTTQNQKRKPAYVAYTVTEQSGSDKDYFTRIGVAFKHSKGDGLTLLLNAVPVDGKVVMRAPQDDSNQGSR